MSSLWGTVATALVVTTYRGAAPYIWRLRSSRLRDAAIAGDVDVVKECLQGGVPVDSEDERMGTPR
jgi:hypothetical protein